MGRPNKRDTKGLYILEKKRRQAYKTVAHFLKVPVQNEDYSVMFSSIPTRYLCIANLGFGGVSGVSPNISQSIFEKLEGFKNVEMPLGMPFSFVEFNSIEATIQAKELIHYKPCSELDNKVLFCDFYDKRENNKELIDFEHPVPGLTLIDEFVTLEEENNMLKIIENYEGWNMVNSRHVKHFGYEFSYKTKHVGSKLQVEFPEFVKPILERFYQQFPNYNKMDQLTISSYPVGAGIPIHCDSHTAFEDTIISLSLKNSIVMEFRKPSTGEMAYRFLKPRSLLILHGEARYGWEHSIKIRKSDPLPNGQLFERKPRVSLTLRKIQHQVNCNCEYKQLCDIEKFRDNK